MCGGDRLLRIVLPGLSANVRDFASLADDAAAREGVLSSHRSQEVDRKIDDPRNDRDLCLEKKMHDGCVLKQRTDDATMDEV